jgi:hypothetical protein
MKGKVQGTINKCRSWNLTRALEWWVSQDRWNFMRTCFLVQTTTTTTFYFPHRSWSYGSCPFLIINLYPHGFPAPAWSILLNYKMCYQTFLLILCLGYHNSPTTLLCCPSRSIKEVYNLILNIAYFFHEKWVKNLLKTRLIKQNSVLNSFVLFLLLKKS